MTNLMPVALVIVMLAPAAAAAQSPAPLPDEPFVVTTGEGVVQAVPDRAWVQITAESRAGNPREAQERNAEAMRPVHDRLRAAGIPADAIRTISYDLQQEWDFVNGRRVSRGYVARNTIEVRVDEIGRVGELLDIAVGAGATAVSGVRFDVKERDRLERGALRLVVADARARAEAAAAGAGQMVDRVVRIEEHRQTSSPPMPFMAVREAAQADAPPIAAGQMELRAQVTLTAILR